MKKKKRRGKEEADVTTNWKSEAAEKALNAGADTQRQREAWA